MADVAPYVVTDEDVASYIENGFLIKRNFYDDAVISLLVSISRAEIARHENPGEMWDSIPYEQHDLGNKTMFNAICFGERMVNGFQRLLREGCLTDACFFHSELLHQSGPSVVPRWAFLVCFDPIHNAPVGVEGRRKPAPIWDDSCLMA